MSCVRFPPTPNAPVIVSAGWDKVVKVWSLSNYGLKNNLNGHTGYLNTGMPSYNKFSVSLYSYTNIFSVTVSPDGSLCASGGKDGIAMLWDLLEGKRLYTLEAGDIIHSLVFSPNRYWLVAATSSSNKI